MRSIVLVVNFFLFISVNAQTIKGNLSYLSNQSVQLVGFNGLETYLISSSIIDEQGNFLLHYSESDNGVAYLLSADDQSLFVILNGEDIEIKGEYLGDIERVNIVKGMENLWFEQYAFENPNRERALNAWIYLEKMYENNPLFYNNKHTYNHIKNEIQRIKEEDDVFLKSLPADSYVKWFLPLRKLLSSIPVIVQSRQKEIWPIVKALRELDYNDPRLYKSGLYKDALEGHFWLLQNSGISLDSVYLEMKFSIDKIVDKLVVDEKKFNQSIEFIFNLLERQSLFEASEYLALKVLNETNCNINSDLSMQLEIYRAMKKGNTAPEILFGESTYLNGVKQHQFKSLASLPTNYTLVVFGASWCPTCVEELPKLIQNYVKWRNLGLEVVYISLDTEKEEFLKMVKAYPFFTYCDFKKWDSQVVKDYFVFGTPTFFLLNSKREIMLRPISVAQIDTWVDWYLGER